MESEDHFNLTLPSSVSMKLHPDNKISDYITEILTPITLNRELYEVGLSEVLLDTKVENVPDKQKAFMVYRNIDYVKKVLGVEGSEGFLIEEEIMDVKYYKETFYTAHGVYKSLSELATYFNAKIMESIFCTDLIFHINKLKGTSLEILESKSSKDIDLRDVKTFYLHHCERFNKGIRSTNNPYTWVKNLISVDEAYLKLFQRHLPAETNHITDGGKINSANTIRFMIDPSILLQGPGMAYIYSNIVEYQYLGDTTVPLLRAVHIDKNTRVISFNHIHYLPLSKRNINSIRLYTRGVEGQAYPFVPGTAVFKLHIRKKVFIKIYKGYPKTMFVIH